MPASRKNSASARQRLRVVLFLEEQGGRWHADQLIGAMESFGATVTPTTLTRCAFDTATKTGLKIPGFDNTLPDGAFVRSIGTGTLEQITFRLAILHALRDSGVRVWNDARVIERCVDKSTATFRFNQHGLPVPRTQTCEQTDLAQSFLNSTAPLVSKPLFGSQGNGVSKITAQSGLPDPDTVGRVHYLQAYVPPFQNGQEEQFADWRIIVSGGRALAAMTRRGKNWITNVHQGATPEPAALTPEMTGLALGAARAVGADYAGVDLIKSPDGRLMVLEINSNPAWKGLQSVTGVKIGMQLGLDFINALKARSQTRTGTPSSASTETGKTHTSSGHPLTPDAPAR